MKKTGVNGENSVFVLLSFEGPDSYSNAGGLGVRITNLSQTLAQKGFTTHLFFIGDPKLKGEEINSGGKLILHRWCQWISAYHPAGVYEGEYQKIFDYNRSIPDYVLENIIKPAVEKNRMVIILAEEWQTTETVYRIDQLLQKQGLRDHAVIFWNANNVFGFENIDFKHLDKACTITTVSKYMKHIMWRMGLNPTVIANGIPKNLVNRVDYALSARLREDLKSDLILAKVARWDPDKRWNMAIEATARLKSRGLKTLLIARGGIEGYGNEVMNHAFSLGLKVKDVYTAGTSLEQCLETLKNERADADILNLRFHCSQELLRLIYHSADAVLANSGREPFGLVGLETMAAGGIAFTGSTGEDYAIPFHNSIVIETSDPKEIEAYILYLASRPEEKEGIRKAARCTAQRFTWERIVDNLIKRLEYQANLQSVITVPQRFIDKAAETADLIEILSNRRRVVPSGVQTI